MAKEREMVRNKKRGRERGKLLPSSNLSCKKQRPLEGSEVGVGPCAALAPFPEPPQVKAKFRRQSQPSGNRGRARNRAQGAREGDVEREVVREMRRARVAEGEVGGVEGERDASGEDRVRRERGRSENAIQSRGPGVGRRGVAFHDMVECVGLLGRFVHPKSL